MAGGESGSRHSARERALGLLYEAETKGLTPAEVLDLHPTVTAGYASDVVGGVGRLQAEVDALIRRFARGWDLERMPSTDRAVLRMAVYELLERDDVPTAVLISEAVELVKRYSTEDSGRFVNGVLAAIAGELRAEPRQR